MKGFLSKLFLYLLIAVTVLTGADYVLSRGMRKAHHPNSEIWNDVMEGRVDADVVALGSSRANTAFYPPVIDSVLHTESWNLGILGNHFISEELRYEMLLRHNRSPRLVVQFVDPLTLMRDASFDRVQFLPWFWDREFRQGLRRYLGDRYFFRNAIPFFRYHSFLPWEVSADKPATLRGFYTYPPDRDDPFSPEREEFLVYESDLAARFRSFLEMLQGDGVSVLMVFPPEHKNFRYAPGQYAAVRDCFASISRETGIPFVDFSGLEMCADSTCFIDISHLNRKGAVAFSDTLAHEILRRGLLR
ncbi:MAG: hypothetical protein IJ603_07155 [Bacteroidales bacterium]|nr:hypothetical protein [Bacteroidales bacterium]